jgi:hypothetical protein
MVIAAGRECVLGTDQSAYQPANNVDAYVQCRAFVWNKVSGGDGGLYADRSFASKNAAMRGRAWRAGYHFLGNENSGEQQAEYFVQQSGGYIDLELPPIVDFETYAGGRRASTAVLHGFATEIHRLIPRRWPGPTGQPIALTVYTGKPMEGGLYPGIDIYDLALAAYLNPYYGNPWNGVTNGCAPNVQQLGSPDRFVPWPWASRGWGAWQFAGGDGGAPGVGNGAAGCDQDVMTTEMFNRLTGGIQPPPEDEMNEADWERIEGMFERYTGIARGSANGPVSTTNRSNLAAFHQDDRAAIIDGILNAQRLTDVGWSGREYFYRASDQANVYELLRVASGRTNPDGTPNYMYARMHVGSQRAAGDSVKFLEGVSMMGRNPAVTILDRNDADQSVILAEFEACPIVNP